MDDAIMPECYVDTNLIETLAPPSGKGYNHQKGCGTVTSKMKKQFSDRFALGIIDRDKQQVEYLNEFNEEIRCGSLILHKHNTKHHYIIQINPAVETFFVTNARQAGISLSDHNLPIDFNLLKKESKQEISKNDQRFKNLFRAIKNAGSKEFMVLGKWVEYLRDNNYQARIEDLKGICEGN